jgi:L-lysine 6-transaminase
MEKSDLICSGTGVRDVIARHMLADGLRMVFDLRRSHGSRIYDSASDRWLLDFFGCFATVAVGYNHPKLCRPEVLDRLSWAAVQKPSNSDVYTAEMADFVKAFADYAMPAPMKYLFFIEGGAPAVENALKTAFDWKVRKNFAAGADRELGGQVLHFRQAFHGRTGYTLSLTNTADPRKTQYFPKFNWPRVTNPKCRFPLEGENLAQVISDEETALSEIRRALDERAPDVACLIIEPIQGEGGDNHFRLEFHRELRRICDEWEILMIYDEVQTGLGGTGTLWAAEQYVMPDIIVFGKKTQVCGIMVSDRIDDIPDHVFKVPSRINSTWGGNLVDMIRCRYILEIFQEENILEGVQRLGERLLDELRQVQEDFPALVTNARGRGLLCAFDLPDRGVRDRVIRRLFQKDLVILGCGERSLRFRTALNIPEEDLTAGLRILREALREEATQEG